MGVALLYSQCVSITLIEQFLSFFRQLFTLTQQGWSRWNFECSLCLYVCVCVCVCSFYVLLKP